LSTFALKELKATNDSLDEWFLSGTSAHYWAILVNKNDKTVEM